MGNQKDISILRELAKKYAELAASDIQDERRDLWRAHNSLRRTRPLVYARWFATSNEIIEPALECEDPFYRAHEEKLRQLIFQDSLGDDYILEPWIDQNAIYICPPHSVWGPEIIHHRTDDAGGSFKITPPITEPADLAKLIVPKHQIDEAETSKNVSRLHDAVGDLVKINVVRAPIWRGWNADLSTDLGYLRGIEGAMWDMIDRPEFLHELLSFMRDGVLAAQEQAEKAGDWRLADHSNQAMTYSEELADPKANSEPVKRKDLWYFAAAQELTLVSPEMHDEFMLQYQIPIIEHFGLSAYGCCEDLTKKIDIVKKIPNLRRIAIVPRADVARCAEQIGTDYVCSWRPNPAEMVCCRFDPQRIRTIVKNAMDAMKGCHVDITLKDVQTVENEPDRLRKWVQLVRDITDKY